MSPRIHSATDPVLQSLRPARRSFPLGIAATIGIAGGAPAFAETQDNDFLALSPAVTGLSSFDAVTAAQRLGPPRHQTAIEVQP